MSSVKPPFTSMPGRAFWGLVVQKGPWKSTYSDYLRAHQVPGGAKGGGVPVGGTGEGKRDAVMTPYQQNGRNPLPDPSEHATQSIVRPGESWKIKKPMIGGKQMKGTKLTYALTISASKKDPATDYEDISHKKGMEPSGPPPPPDLKSTFLTEDRLAKSRNKNGLTVVTRNLRRAIDSSSAVSQPPSYSTGAPPSYRSSSGRPMDLDSMPPGGPRSAGSSMRGPSSGRSAMSVDTTPGGGLGGLFDSPSNLISGSGGDFSIPISGVPSPSTPGTTMSVDTASTSFTPPVIDQVVFDKTIDEELRKLREKMEARTLTMDTSNLPPPTRRAGMQVIGSSLDPGGMRDVANEFYPTEKRKNMMEGGSGREKKGKLTLTPRPQEPREDIITSRGAEKMKKAVEAKKGALKGKFAPSNVKPKRKAEDQGVSGRTKKGKLAPKEGLKIQVTGLAPSKQSSTKSSQFKPKEKTMEDKSAPKKFDTLPEVRSKRSGAAKPPKGGVSKKAAPKKKK